MIDIDVIILALEIGGYFTSIFGVVVLFVYGVGFLLVVRH